jgi:hypothetical protein
MISTCGKCLILHNARRPGISGFAEKIRQVSVKYGQASALFHDSHLFGPAQRSERLPRQFSLILVKKHKTISLPLQNVCASGL